MSQSQIELELPDARTLTVPADATPLDVAREIGRGLAKAALAGELDGKCLDLRAPLGRGGRFRVITARDPEGGEERITRRSSSTTSTFRCGSVPTIWRRSRPR